MNTVISNQYGRVQGQLMGEGLALNVDAETPRRDSVHLELPIQSPEQQLQLLAVLRAVEQRIDEFQLKESKGDEAEPWEQSSDQESVCLEGELPSLNGTGRGKVYGRFAQFLIYEQIEQDRLRVFFAARDDDKRVARFDLHSGEVQAFRALVERALFRLEQIDLLIRDDISLCVGLNASAQGIGFDVQTALWHSQFSVDAANKLGTLAVFAHRAIKQCGVAPIYFGSEDNRLAFRRRPDGKIMAEFQCRKERERMALSTLHIYELEVLARYALRRAFDPAREVARGIAVEQSVARTQ